MISLNLVPEQLPAALVEGVEQCVLIGPRPIHWEAASEDPLERKLQVFAVDRSETDTETLEASLQKADFDKLKATLFVWLGGAGYRTVDGALAALSFIASLPRGSAVIFDYAVERIRVRGVADEEPELADGARSSLEQPATSGLGFVNSLRTPTDLSSYLAAFARALSIGNSFTNTALDALASRICAAGGSVKLLIQPQAVAAMLRGAGFQKIIDLACDETHFSGGHLVTAFV